MKILVAELERAIGHLLQNSILRQRYQIESLTDPQSNSLSVEHRAEPSLSTDVYPQLRPQQLIGADISLIVIDADWITSDSMDPEFNGVDLCQQLRVQGISTPILLIIPQPVPVRAL